ncbi:hypothetical protein E2C01_031245 [Portunus trituberculatus]|uniref:Uncharacterized protein n=1 Tax=Portunus trituberculatus TaxID=210409 RepID=A0A5B7EZK1_PORTR|nr:hypothetical protein [Portunus trituberculatus]
MRHQARSTRQPRRWRRLNLSSGDKAASPETLGITTSISLSSLDSDAEEAFYDAEDNTTNQGEYTAVSLFITLHLSPVCPACRITLRGNKLQCFMSGSILKQGVVYTMTEPHFASTIRESRLGEALAMHVKHLWLCGWNRDGVWLGCRKCSLTPSRRHRQCRGASFCYP